MSDERPKSGGKGDERPKSGGKGDERPKSGGKGGGSGADAAGAGAGAFGDNGAAEILRRASELSGLLVVAVVAPLGGGGGGASICSGPSPQKLALGELRRKAEFRQRESQNEPTPRDPSS